MVNPNEMSTYGGITPRSTPATTPMTRWEERSGESSGAGAGAERAARDAWRALCSAAKRICNQRSDIQRLYVTPIISL